MLFNEDCDWDCPHEISIFNESIFKKSVVNKVSKHSVQADKRNKRKRCESAKQMEVEYDAGKALQPTMKKNEHLKSSHAPNLAERSEKKVKNKLKDAKFEVKQKGDLAGVAAEQDMHSIPDDSTSNAAESARDRKPKKKKVKLLEQKNAVQNVKLSQCADIALSSSPHSETQMESSSAPFTSCSIVTSDHEKVSFSSKQKRKHDDDGNKRHVKSKKRKLVARDMNAETSPQHVQKVMHATKSDERELGVKNGNEKFCSTSGPLQPSVKVSNSASKKQHTKPFNISRLRSVLEQNSAKSVADNDSQLARKNNNKPQKIAKPVANKTTDLSDDPELKGFEVEGRGGGSLKDRMMDRLAAARFRYINEQLYSTTGSEAADMFARDEEAFNVYHSAFQSQVNRWPTNPVDKMIEYIRSHKYAVVADFGCGDAKIAQSVTNKVHSFDLIALNEHVTACDMAKVPLKSSVIDIAVFCLSLMGTNLVDFLTEAHRVLKPGGVLLVAEVVSRFDKMNNFVHKLHKLGFTLQNKVLDNKMFVWFEFKKTGSLPAHDKLPSIKLLPCTYKKR